MIVLLVQIARHQIHLADDTERVHAEKSDEMRAHQLSHELAAEAKETEITLAFLAAGRAIGRGEIVPEGQTLQTIEENKIRAQRAPRVFTRSWTPQLLLREELRRGNRARKSSAPDSSEKPSAQTG